MLGVHFFTHFSFGFAIKSSVAILQHLLLQMFSKPKGNYQFIKQGKPNFLQTLMLTIVFYQIFRPLLWPDNVWSSIFTKK